MSRQDVSLSYPDLPVSFNDIFRRSQRFKAHRPPCMKLLRADADFGAIAEFKAVRKTRGSIVVNRCSVNRR